MRSFHNEALSVGVGTGEDAFAEPVELQMDLNDSFG